MANFTPYQAQGNLAISSANAGRIDPGSVTSPFQNAAGLLSGLAERAHADQEKARKKLEQTEAQSYVRDEVSGAERLFSERMIAAQEKAIGAASGFTPDFMAGFEDYAAARLDAAPNDMARDALEERFATMRTSLYGDALAFETGARRVERAVGYDQSVSDLSAAAFAMPDRYGALLSQAEADIDAAEAAWATPQQAAKMRADAKDRVTISAMRGLIQQDPEGALAALTEQAERPSNPIAAGLSVEQRASLAGTARGEVSRRQQQRQATLSGLADRINGALSVVRSGFQPDPTELDRLTKEVGRLGPEGADLRADLARLNRFTDFAEEFRQMTPAQMGGWITAEETRLRESGATPEDVARFGLARAALDRAKAGYGDVKSRVADLETVLKAGMKPDPETVQNLVSDLTDLGDAAAIERLRRAAEQGDQRNATEALAPVTATAALGEAETRLRREGDVTADDLAALNNAKAMQAEVENALRDDPIAFGQRIGIVDTKPLDLSDPREDPAGNPADTGGSPGQTAVDGMRRRRAEALALSAKYGTLPRFLTDTEKDLWTTVLSEGDPDARLRALLAIHKGFGDRSGDVLAELSDRAPTLAAIGGLVSDPSGVPAGREALSGAAILAAENGRRPSPSLTMPLFNAETGGTLADAPATGAALREVANSIYVARGGLGDPANFDEDLYREAVQSALGQTRQDQQSYGGSGSVNGAITLLPPRVNALEVEMVLKTITATQLQAISVSVDGGGTHLPTFADGTQAGPEDIREAQLQPVGADTYLLRTEDGFLAGDGPAGYFAITLDRDTVTRILTTNGSQDLSSLLGSFRRNRGQ